MTKPKKTMMSRGMGGGRKPDGNSPKVKLSITLDRELAEWLVSKAAEMGVSKSAIIEESIRQRFAENIEAGLGKIAGCPSHDRYQQQSLF